MAPPEIIYGTSFLGINDLDSEAESLRLLEYVWSRGVRTFDTAGLYPPLGEAGKSERILARFAATHPTARLWSKTAVTGDWSGRGNLTRDMVLTSAAASRRRLGRAVDVFFPHTPDPATPCAESAVAFAEARRAGDYLRLGLSNFSADQTVRFCDAVEEAGLPAPVVAQWQYNPLCRYVEEDLLPLYSSKGIAFAAYSPLAGGFLTGKVTEGRAQKSRFDPEYFPPGKILYGDVYDKPPFHEAYRLLKEEASKYGLDVPNASMRWLLHHSALRDGDAIIMGATKFSQAEEILEGLRKHDGPLESGLVQVFDRAWELVKDEHVVRHGMDG